MRLRPFRAGLILGIGWLTAGVVHAQAVYWADLGPTTNGRIVRTNLAGGAFTPLVNAGGNRPAGLAFDTMRGKVYWSEYFSPNGTAAVRRANLDGSGAELVVSTGPSYGVAVDPAGGRIYWTRPDGVYRSMLDGSEEEPFIPSAATGSEAFGVALDLVNEQIYWTESGGVGDVIGRIRRAELDGSDAVDLVTTNNAAPVAIALDVAGGQMYWVDSNLRNLQRALLSGANATQLAGPTGAEFPTGVALDLETGKVYWGLADLLDGIGRIRRANLNGSSPENFAPAVFDPQGIYIRQTPEIVGSLPPSCAIDARQPHDIGNAAIRFGWNFVDLQFSSAPPTVGVSDFDVIEIGDDGIGPSAALVTPLGPGEVRVTLSTFIDPGAWTCVRYLGSYTQACVGYLPGDVNADRSSGPVDILRLIDALNGIVDYEAWQTDVNRSGLTEPSDVLRVIDLLNGADQFDPWLGAALPPCPST